MTQIKLQFPVQADGRTLSTLTLRRPKVRDERDARRIGGDDDAEREIALFSNLCGVAPDTIHDLDLADYRRLTEAFNAFFPSDAPAPEPSAEQPPS